MHLAIIITFSSKHDYIIVGKIVVSRLAGDWLCNSNIYCINPMANAIERLKSTQKTLKDFSNLVFQVRRCENERGRVDQIANCAPNLINAPTTSTQHLSTMTTICVKSTILQLVSLRRNCVLSMRLLTASKRNLIRVGKVYHALRSTGFGWKRCEIVCLKIYKIAFKLPHGLWIGWFDGCWCCCCLNFEGVLWICSVSSVGIIHINYCCEPDLRQERISMVEWPRGRVGDPFEDGTGKSLMSPELQAIFNWIPRRNTKSPSRTHSIIHSAIVHLNLNAILIE